MLHVLREIADKFKKNRRRQFGRSEASADGATDALLFRPQRHHGINSRGALRW
jgi:hypothetical protein